MGFFDFLFGKNEEKGYEKVGNVPINFNNKGQPCQWLNDNGEWVDFTPEEMEEMKSDHSRGNG